jgi:hypothetical protein
VAHGRLTESKVFRCYLVYYAVPATLRSFGVTLFMCGRLVCRFAAFQ